MTRKQKTFVAILQPLNGVPLRQEEHTTRTSELDQRVDEFIKKITGNLITVKYLQSSEAEATILTAIVCYEVNE